jgi:hypothetical protein
MLSSIALSHYQNVKGSYLPLRLGKDVRDSPLPPDKILLKLISPLFAFSATVSSHFAIMSNNFSVCNNIPNDQRHQGILTETGRLSTVDLLVLTSLVQPRAIY